MRFTKQLADDVIARFNTLKGLDGVETGSLYRYSASGRQRLCRVSKGHGQIDVGYGIMTSKDVVMVVDSMIDQHYWDQSDQPLVSVELYPRFPELSTLAANTGRSVDALVKQAVNAMLSDSPGPLTQVV